MRRGPNPRSRRVFAFHKPETLLASLEKGETLRSRLAALPPLDKRGLRDCQIEAVEGLEVSLAKADPRALIQMATGSGKTFTACTFSYRLLKFADAKRILFLVDRNNLGKQTLNEFQQFQSPYTLHSAQLMNDCPPAARHRSSLNSVRFRIDAEEVEERSRGVGERVMKDAYGPSVGS